jgi:hypothetical protein
MTIYEREQFVELPCRGMKLFFCPPCAQLKHNEEQGETSEVHDCKTIDREGTIQCSCYHVAHGRRS